METPVEDIPHGFIDAESSPPWRRQSPPEGMSHARGFRGAGKGAWTCADRVRGARWRRDAAARAVDPRAIAERTCARGAPDLRSPEESHSSTPKTRLCGDSLAA